MVSLLKPNIAMKVPTVTIVWHPNSSSYSWPFHGLSYIKYSTNWLYHLIRSVADMLLDSIEYNFQFSNFMFWLRKHAKIWMTQDFAVCLDSPCTTMHYSSHTWVKIWVIDHIIYMNLFESKMQKLYEFHLRCINDWCVIDRFNTVQSRWFVFFTAIS